MLLRFSRSIFQALPRTATACRTVRTRAVLEGPEEIGVKTKLMAHLKESGHIALTADELWSRTEAEGVKSKRHMKQMLAQMKASRVVSTVPLGAHAHKKGKQFGYLLLENRAAFQRHRAENPHGISAAPQPAA